ncbi:peptide chain release factor N(5)-glutamine methyltransferase [Polaribacter sp. HL-MS24]|uniref:peptide chain release factor N(5)-glutamine methyltransferase n=1 Tax=Polaribacter sp. HL-MS24 TaxID=3077735 RepID=UPI002934E8A1|nr:peptide chain release factor N(5)-glutamine methyltransferase [Polaribacter sp. HL-MS24]WOC40498.1 peptide chain release factor N(5)-glutamine methyltransferase [Polaribacter sp. HL-MS24]
MILKEYQSYFSQELSAIYPQTEIDTFFFFLIEEYIDFQRIDLVLKPDFELSSDILPFFKNALEALQKEIPIQYILGKTEFYGFPFLVNSDTLIPRPETEELVEWILNVISPTKKTQIIDIGTGSGCIPISLAKHLPNATIFALDISKEALTVAKQNAILNKVAIYFIETNILQTNHLAQKFDVIISNPPYVRELEKFEIKKNVLENEPHLALFVTDEDPLLFYNKIADLAAKHLTPNGLLFLEINQYLGKETIKMLAQKGFTNIELKKDHFGNDRMIKCHFNNLDSIENSK